MGKIGDLMSEQFNNAFKEVILSKSLGGKSLLKVTKLAKAIKEEQDNANAVRKTLLEKHCTKKEDGSPEVSEKGEYTIPNDAVQDYLREWNDAMEVELDKSLKICYSDIEKVSLSAADLLSLECILELES